LRLSYNSKGEAYHDAGSNETGRHGRAKKLQAKDKLGHCLMDIGVYTGLRSKVVHIAPLAKPMEVEFGRLLRQPVA
jgi:Fe2+ transport system protein FeoA